MLLDHTLPFLRKADGKRRSLLFLSLSFKLHVVSIRLTFKYFSPSIMSTNNSSDDSGSTFEDSEISLPRSIRFWLMLLINVPSIICSCCIITHVIINRAHRQALHNHTILLMLIFGLPVQLMDISFYLAFFQRGIVEPQHPLVCRLWWFADYGIYNGGLFLMAWLAIERHILIFNDQWVSNRTGRILLHYIPLATIVMYIILFYTIAVFFLPCEDSYDYTLPVCGASPCYQSYGILGMFEFIVNTSIPIILEGLSSIVLIIRVQLQKRRLRQSIQWRKHRRMIIQLFLISGLNICLNLPISIIPIAHMCGLPPEYGVQAELYFFFLGYFVIFSLPFISLCQFPDLRKQMKKKIFCIVSRQPDRTAAVAPTKVAIPMVRLT